MKINLGPVELISYPVIVFLFFFGFFQGGSVAALALMVLIWIYQKKYKETWKVFRDNKTVFILLGFYLLHLVSLAWTENYAYAAFDLQVKLAFLICPVLLSGFHFSKREMSLFRLAFVSGLTVTILVFLSRAIYLSLAHGSMEYFFYEKFSVFLHPTYLSIYLNLSVLFLLYELFWERVTGKKVRSFYFLSLAVQVLAIILLSARTSSSVALVSCTAFVFILYRKRKIGRSDVMLLAMAFAIVIVAELLVLKVYNRFTQVKNVVHEFINSTVTLEENSTTIRVQLWKNAAEVIGEHPLTGVGIGDIKEELVKKYTENKYEYGIRNRISPHNQYLHTMVILGLPGFIFLAGLLLVAFIKSWRTGDWLYVLFVLIVSMNCMTESILERQAGILFFAFFNSLFAARLLQVKRLEPNES